MALPLALKAGLELTVRLPPAVAEVMLPPDDASAATVLLKPLRANWPSLLIVTVLVVASWLLARSLAVAELATCVPLPMARFPAIVGPAERARSSSPPVTEVVPL